MSTILFDLDDTLIQSMYVWEDAIKALFKELHIDMDFERAKQTFMAKRFSEVLVYIKKYFYPHATIQQMNDFCMAFVIDQYQHHVPATKGAVEFVHEQAKKGTTMAVVTSNDFHLTKTVLQRLDMYDSMKEIFSAEELHMTKREPEIYEYALNKLNAQPKDTIVFEDSMYAIETARSLGIRCIGIENDWNRRDFMKNHVETIHDFTELHSFL